LVVIETTSGSSGLQWNTQATVTHLDALQVRGASQSLLWQQNLFSVGDHGADRLQ
jgi:hypothetical protein